ncbi:uncharacterized protein MYCFIDRAFT_172077 [Pseudocercospora fijiensis CIRAD86]|uniref:Uncharacterized protein n=1 Tax=Pseudocercospora fijiensis (strain CIRAD86) TaxID=383855 RepID=M3ANZ8_PSEFD|nr:uncharacterized protein MYCFIDRAFT_172077 [Pseudocercospora fijiensis CIRAD86]EME86306.1 hypothetical protein MYCFIDRAFT_172077 [Pseudocercospora fijiensis CIRAD86]
MHIRRTLPEEGNENDLHFSCSYRAPLFKLAASRGFCKGPVDEFPPALDDTSKLKLERPRLIDPKPAENIYRIATRPTEMLQNSVQLGQRMRGKTCLSKSGWWKDESRQYSWILLGKKAITCGHPNVRDFYKGKYFKIQAAHKVPPDAKYSQSNVTREKKQTRDAKRRKFAEQKSMRGRIHCRLDRSRILATCGLQREIGNKANHYRDEAIVEGWSLERTEITPSVRIILRSPSFLDCQYLPRSRCLATVLGDRNARRYMFFCEDTCISSGRDAMPVTIQERAVDFEAIDGDTPIMFASGDCDRRASAHFRVGPLEGWFTSTVSNAFLHTHSVPSIRHLWTSKVEMSKHNVALAGTGAISVNCLDHGAQICELQLEECEVFSIDWLSGSTLAYGALEETKNARHCVKLWDIRSQGQASRFQKNRRITGVSSIDGSGHNLLISSNISLDLHDLRMTRSIEENALLSIPHTSVGPQLNYDILSPGSKLIAAADQYNNSVHIYSLGTGKHTRTAFLAG